jgi:hypothetical protein
VATDLKCTAGCSGEPVEVWVNRNDPLKRDHPMCRKCVESCACVRGEFVVRCVTAKPAAPDKKDTNPKDLVGTRKVPLLSVIPLRVLGEVALALFEGARKYGRFNWRKSGVVVSVYVDAAGRHLAEFYEGVDIDKASGVHHLSKAIAGLMVLRDSLMHGNAIDDRPPRAAEGWVDAQNEQAVSIIERHPNAVPPYTEVNL